MASLVNKNRCYEIGKSLKLEKYILVGNSNINKTKIENKIISDCIEALIGAVFFEKGFDQTEKFVLKMWKNLIDSSDVTTVDSKTKLQEYSLKKYKTLPIYKLMSSSGPKHNPVFKAEVQVENQRKFSATGSSKKDAEQNAAKKLINHLKI